MTEPYKQKVALLITILPYINEEPDLALHGGTAINLFVRDMLRLSVDIDLTYLPVRERQESLEHINQILGRIKSKVEQGVKDSMVDHDEARWKLIIRREATNVKLEVNTIIRGTMSNPQKMTLCERAQTEFEAFAEMSVVPLGQLYGGKICAALDRQHPRDIFDVKYLLEEEGFTDEVRSGFIFSLVSSARPTHELIKPNFKDQKKTMDNQFTGMSEEEFSYEEFENTRGSLVETMRTGLTAEDKAFLLSLKKLEPDWSIYDFERFPAVRWKIQNIETLKEKDDEKYQAQIKALEDALAG